MEPSRAGGKIFPSERLVVFSDGVMAVAITLLVLDLKLPPGVTDAGCPRLWPSPCTGSGATC